MKYIIAVVAILTLSLLSCEESTRSAEPRPDFKVDRSISISNSDSLYRGKSYLPVYSQIYQQDASRKFDLAITVSLRNVSAKDTVFLLQADYYDSTGDKIKSFLENPAYLLPMETIDVVIDERDEAGGTGGNFIFDWAKRNDKNPPLFEAVMISTLGAQGISFTTRAIHIDE